jgi:hypothetical protein
MHIYLVSLIDKKVQEAMVKFSNLPIQTSVLSIRPFEELLYHSGTILKTYIKLLKTLHILSKDYDHYYRRQLLIKHTLSTVIIENNQAVNKDYLRAIHNMVLPFLQDESSDQPAIIPIHIHFTTISETFLFSGISICKRDNTLAYSLLHETSMPNSQIHGYSIPGYLEELWDTYLQNPSTSLRALCSGHKSYTGFQKDSKHYLGTTFYRFYQQYKMLEVLDDLMLTDLSIKEIAYKHEFTDYNQLYKLFHRQYRFPFKDISRLAIENIMLHGVLFAIFL